MGVPDSGTFTKSRVGVPESGTFTKSRVGERISHEHKQVVNHYLYLHFHPGIYWIFLSCHVSILYIVQLYFHVGTMII